MQLKIYEFRINKIFNTIFIASVQLPICKPYNSFIGP